MAAATMDTGIVTAGISVARKRAQEQEDDDEHQDQRLGQREHHVLERRGDEHAVVDVDLDRDVLGQRLLHFREPLLHRARRWPARWPWTAE